MKKILNMILLISLYIVSGLFLYHTYKLNILNHFYFGIVSFISGLLGTLITFELLRKKTGKISKIVFTMISIVLISIYIVGIIYIGNTRNYISNMSNQETKEYKTYNVLVLKSSNYHKIRELKNNEIGFLETDTTHNLSINTLKEKIDFNSKVYSDIELLTKSLYISDVKAISIDESYIDILEENDSPIINDTKVIYTYKVSIDKDNGKNDIKNDNINTNKPFILYISGSDSRTSVRETARSDVNIIAVVNPNTKKILLVSIPRDYYVKLHGTTGTKDKLTHAGVYGINMSINTIEDLLSINIDKYIKVSFATVIKSVDILDGIDIDSDTNFTAWTNKSCSFKVGIQHVDGNCALAFARERKSYTEGDRHRGENQEQVISKIIEKLSNPKYLLKYNDLLNATNDSFETDMSYEEITSLIKEEISSLAKWEIETYNLSGFDSSGPTYSMGSQVLYVMIPDQSTVNTAKIKIEEYLK